MPTVLLAHRSHDDGVAEARHARLPPDLPWHAAALRAAGHSVVVASFGRLVWRDVERFIADLAPDLVVARCHAANRRAAVRLLRVARRACPAAACGLDGRHARVLAPLLLRRVRELDFIVTEDAARVLPLLAAHVGDTKVRERSGRSLAGVDGIVVGEGERGPAAPASRPASLDALGEPRSGLDGAGLVPERDFPILIAQRAPGWEPGLTSREQPFEGPLPTIAEVVPRSVDGLVREARVLRDEHGILDVSVLGPRLFADRGALAELGGALLDGKVGIAWHAEGALSDLEPADRAEEESLARALASCQRAGLRSVTLDLDERRVLEEGEGLGSRLAAVSTRLRASGIAVRVRAWHGTPEAIPGATARLRGLIRAARPSEGVVLPRILRPATSDWEDHARWHEVDETFWIEDERDEIPAAPARRLELAQPALEQAMRDAVREASPTPRDLEAVERRLGEGCWTLIDWGEFRAARADLDEAARCFRRAARSQPWNAHPWLRLAAAAARGSRPDAELEAEGLRGALDRVPRLQEARTRLQELNRRRRRRRRGSSD